MADRQWNTQFSKICYWYFLIIAITAVSSATASFTMEYLVNNCSFLYPHRSNSVSILIWILYILTNFFSFAHTFVNRDSKMCQENKVWILQYCRVGWYCCFILVVCPPFLSWQHGTVAPWLSFCIYARIVLNIFTACMVPVEIPLNPESFRILWILYLLFWNFVLSPPL